MNVKRKNSDGNTIYFDNSKSRWVAQYSITINGERFRPSRTGITESEAINKLEIAKTEFFKKIAQQKFKRYNTKETLGSVIEKLLLSIEGTVECSSYGEYCNRAKAIYQHDISNTLISKLDKTAIQRGLNEIAQDHEYCESVCQKLIQFLKRTFAFACDEKIIGYANNPIAKEKCLKIPICAKENKDILPLTTTSKDQILSVLEGLPRFKPIVYCMLFSGLRVCEVLALKWTDIDFSENKIHIREAVKKSQKIENGKKVVTHLLGKTKTKQSKRTVPMSSTLRDCLLIWAEIQNFYAKDLTGLNLVFPKPNGSLMNYDAYNMSFNKNLRRLGIDCRIYHSRVFRHTYASYLVKSQKIQPKTLMKLMGHANIETTLKYYIDTDEQTLIESALIIDDIMTNSEIFSFGVAV